MNKKPVILPRICVAGFCLTLLTACVGKADTEQESADYIGWRCDDARLQRGEPCEQVRVVKGREQPLMASVEEKPAETKTEGESQTIAKTRELILVGDLRPRPWQQQLPGFRVEAGEKPGVVSANYRDEAAPVPEQAFSDELYAGGDHNGITAEHIDDGTAVNIGFENKPDGEPERASRSESEPSPEPESAYTVQLGAFASADEAQRFLERHKLLHLDITRGHHEKDGRRWHVLSFGVFADRSGAEKAWAAAAANADGLDVWIRRLRR